MCLNIKSYHKWISNFVLFQRSQSFGQILDRGFVEKFLKHIILRKKFLLEFLTKNQTKGKGIHDNLKHKKNLETLIYLGYGNVAAFRRAIIQIQLKSVSWPFDGWNVEGLKYLEIILHHKFQDFRQKA